MIHSFTLFLLFLFTIKAELGGVGFLAFRNGLGLLQNSEKDFEPYAENGGTVVGLAGKDYVIIAADTRLVDTAKYFISSRECTRIHMVSGQVMLSSTGCFSDSVALLKQLQRILRTYNFDNKMPLSPQGLASRLSVELYLRRSMPYYCSCVLGGIDARSGCLFAYDPLGSYEQTPIYCVGKGAVMIQPMLDEAIDQSMFDGIWVLDGAEFSSSEPSCVHLTKQEALSLVLRCFKAAAERETSIGDGIDIFILERNPDDSTIPLIEKRHYSLPVH